jgi:hypothetical protein
MNLDDPAATVRVALQVDSDKNDRDANEKLGQHHNSIRATVRTGRLTLHGTGNPIAHEYSQAANFAW